MTPQPIRFDNLTLGYDRHPAIHHLTGTIRPGALLAVVGPNGAGKSTLLKAIAGLLRPLDGRLDLGGLQTGDLAYLPQQAEIDRAFPITVADLVALGDWGRSGAFGAVSATSRRRIGQALATVGLAGFEGRLIGTLSGGQFQRLLFARLLLQDAPVILLDEPFLAVDQRTVADLIAVLLAWHAEGRTVVAVLHELDLVHRYFPDCLLLARSPVAWGETAAVLAPAALSRARTMAEGWDEAASVCERSAA